MNDLHSLALKAGAAYWQEPGAEKPTYLLSIDELEKLVGLIEMSVLHESDIAKITTQE